MHYFFHLVQAVSSCSQFFFLSIRFYLSHCYTGNIRICQLNKVIYCGHDDIVPLHGYDIKKMTLTSQHHFHFSALINSLQIDPYLKMYFCTELNDLLICILECYKQHSCRFGFCHVQQGCPNFSKICSTNDRCDQKADILWKPRSALSSVCISVKAKAVIRGLHGFR